MLPVRGTRDHRNSFWAPKKYVAHVVRFLYKIYLGPHINLLVARIASAGTTIPAGLHMMTVRSRHLCSTAGDPHRAGGPNRATQPSFFTANPYAEYPRPAPGPAICANPARIFVRRSPSSSKHLRSAKCDFWDAQYAEAVAADVPKLPRYGEIATQG